jgi:Fe-S-cluster containining protein
MEALAGRKPAPQGCRPGCGACCIALSISSPLPGHPAGKPAGVPCRQLAQDFRCRLYGLPERPRVCAALRPEPLMCGGSREQALAYLAGLEAATAPGS